MLDFASDEWTPRQAEGLADRRGIELSERHWRAITAARELAVRHGRAPSIREISASCALQVAEIKELFGASDARVLNEIAGAIDLERRSS